MRLIFAPAHGMDVEITNARDPAKTVVAVKEKDHSGDCYVETVEIRVLEEKVILIDLIQEHTILGKPASLPPGFRHHPETSPDAYPQSYGGREGYNQGILLPALA